MSQVTAADPFDDLADIYGAMIDWPKRLANETPFYRWLFESVGGAKRVLDAACGAGLHAAMFHAWGLQVEGADLSPAMIARCRAHFGEPAGLRWVVRGFDQPAAGAFDAAICVGNSLALAPDEPAIRQALAAMLGSVRPGGALLIHIVNLWRLPEGEPVWQKCRRAQVGGPVGGAKAGVEPGAECLIIKGIHRAGNFGFVDLLIADLAASNTPAAPATPAAPQALRTECVRFQGLDPAELELWLRAAGAACVELFGDYQRRAYQREKSQDLIAVAWRT